MAGFLIHPSTLKGSIKLPTSKSQSLRAILFATMGDGKSLIQNYLPSSDTYSMIDACRHFGAIIDLCPDHLRVEGIKGKIEKSEDVLQAGNSGIVLRFCSAIGALAANPIVVTGDHSIRHQRAMQPLLSGLSQLGVSARSMRGDGYAPVIIEGPLKGGEAFISGEDSQPVSALLIAAAFAEEAITLHVKNPGEKPWVGLTLHWFDQLGIPYKNDAFTSYEMKGRARYSGFEYKVPGDLSSAAFPIAAALVTQSELIVENVDLDDPQGDKEVIAIFRRMGAKIDYDKEQQRLFVHKSPPLRGIKVDINACIDAVTILAVVACYAQGETHIENGAIAKQKESDRLHGIARELKKMGAAIEETKDGLIIQGRSLHGATLDSYHDHRMVMSLAVAAFGAEGETKISPIDSVSKTFPTFRDDFVALGAKIEELL